MGGNHSKDENKTTLTTPEPELLSYQNGPKVPPVSIPPAKTPANNGK